MNPGSIGFDFQQIVTEYEKILYAFVLQRAPERDSADIVQETFVKAYLKIHTLQNPDSLKPWLFAICRNCLSNHTRKSRSNPEMDFDAELHQEVFHLNQDNSSSTEIRIAMDQLEYPKRQYLVLKYWAGLSYEEIAVLLQTTEKRVKSRLYEARQVLKQVLEQSLLTQPTAPPQSMKEKIMNKIECIQNAAGIIARLSLASQLQLAEHVRENKSFDTNLLSAFADVDGGADFVTTCHGKLSVVEFADILQAVDSETVNRLLSDLKKTYKEYAVDLKTEMALAEVNIVTNESLQVETEKVPGCNKAIIARLIGYIDTYNADLFENKIRALITTGYQFLILDCSKFTYISSSGLGALLALLNELSLQNGSIFLCKLDNHMWEIFSFLGINSFFKKTESINQAIKLCEIKDPFTVSAEPAEQEIIRLLPKENAGDSCLEIAGFSRFSQEQTGSYYDYKALGNHNWAVIMTEVAGKGANTQLIRGKIAAAFHHYFEHTEAPYNVSELMYAFNSHIVALNIKNRFAVITLMLVNATERSCTVCQAAANSLTVYRDKEQKTISLSAPIGPAAGTFPNWLVRDRNPYTAVDFCFNSNDGLYLFTDGLEESQNAAGALFGRERIAEIITAAHRPATKNTGTLACRSRLCVDALVSAEQRFRGEADPSDDIMILAIAFS